MGRLKHAKKRNVGLVYELLVRSVSDAAIAGDARRASIALSIMDRHFGPKGPLAEELELHRSVMEARGSSEQVARRIVDELRLAGVRLRGRGLDRSRTDLIHEINRTLGPEVFDLRVPDYVAHASVGILLQRPISGHLAEGADYARVEEALVSFLTRSPDAPRAIDPDECRFAYDAARRLYAEGYGKELDAAQAELLREFVRWQMGGPGEPLFRVVDRQRSLILDALRAHRSDEVFEKDGEMRKRLDEAIDELRAPWGDVDDAVVERLMLLHDLRREVLS